MMDEWGIMPDLTRRGASYRHTLASSVESLRQAGVPESAISFRFDGSGGPPDYVVDQDPQPGTSLELVQRVSITLSGFGMFHQLPFGYRIDAEDEDVVSTSAIMGLFDSEVTRMRYWCAEASLFFGIGPDRHEANRRWLLLFGLDPDIWPQDRHFTLCTIVPNLHRMAGTEAGVRLLLAKLMDVEVAEIRHQRSFCEIVTEDRNSMTPLREFENTSDPDIRKIRNLTLGVNSILGGTVEKVRSCHLQLGPVTLEKWHELTSESGKNRLKHTLDLCMPLGIDYSYRFIVGDRRLAPELGSAERNCVLGRNTHLGQQSWPAEERSVA